MIRRRLLHLFCGWPFLQGGCSKPANVIRMESPVQDFRLKPISNSSQQIYYWAYRRPLAFLGTLFWVLSRFSNVFYNGCSVSISWMSHQIHPVDVARYFPINTGQSQMPWISNTFSYNKAVLFDPQLTTSSATVHLSHTHTDTHTLMHMSTLLLWLPKMTQTEQNVRLVSKQ